MLILHNVIFLTSIPWAVRFSWLENAYSHPLFRWAILTCKAGHTGLVFGVNQGSLVDLCEQDHKSLCAAITICATVVNIQTGTQRDTDRQHFDQLIWTGQPAELKIYHALNSQLKGMSEGQKLVPLCYIFKAQILCLQNFSVIWDYLIIHQLCPCT